jgi:hypothetical protein
VFARTCKSPRTLLHVFQSVVHHAPLIVAAAQCTFGWPPEERLLWD